MSQSTKSSASVAAILEQTSDNATNFSDISTISHGILCCAPAGFVKHAARLLKLVNTVNN